MNPPLAERRLPALPRFLVALRLVALLRVLRLAATDDLRFGRLLATAFFLVALRTALLAAALAGAFLAAVFLAGVFLGAAPFVVVAVRAAPAVAVDFSLAGVAVGADAFAGEAGLAGVGLVAEGDAAVLGAGALAGCAAGVAATARLSA